MTSSTIRKELRRVARPATAKNLQRFFKTGKGEYGEGDKFLGIVVPDIRMIAKKYTSSATLADIKRLLQSPWHEIRLTALLILTYQYPLATPAQQEKICKLYLKNTKYINNWDLVDLSAYKITGPWLLAKKDRQVLYTLAKSKNIWERRIAVLTTFCFIKAGEFTDSLRLARLLLDDPHDLLHKAVGWMLREIGKRDDKTLIRFLDRYATRMPRTMLRYAIERLTAEQRRQYLSVPHTKKRAAN